MVFNGFVQAENKPDLVKRFVWVSMKTQARLTVRHVTYPDSEQVPGKEHGPK